MLTPRTPGMIARPWLTATLMPNPVPATSAATVTDANAATAVVLTPQQSAQLALGLTAGQLARMIHRQRLAAPVS